MKIHHISSEHLTIERVREIIEQNYTLALSDEAVANIQKCRDYLDNKMKTQKEPIYGITTGFGSLCNISISQEDLSTLQRNLVMSHSCGFGEEVPHEIVKLIILFKIQSLSYGHSGVQVQTVKRLIEFFNNDIFPVIYQQGSLGASGDLSPLAHMSLPLLGLGYVDFKGERISGEELNRRMGWESITLQSKEGLALLNGTQFMCGFGVWSVMNAMRLSKSADTIAAVSLEGFDGRREPFFHHIHDIRPHNGQRETARRMSELLEGSEIATRYKAHVQDPYSFRCIPQVHGASKDAIEYVKGVFTTEINSATDNPNVFPDEDIVVSGGNFHGQPLAIALDFLSIAVAELGSISGQRTNQLIMGKRDLPSFLVAKPGLNSGFMIPQYTAASIVSQSKQLCTPASVDSIESSQGQEDHVSMGANAATKCRKVVQNTERVLAIELFNATQAFEFRRPLKSSAEIEEIVSAYRKEIPFVDIDRVMYESMHKTVEFMRKNLKF